MANFGPSVSRYKMVVYLKNGDRKVYYSLLKEEQKNPPDKVVSNMVRRLLFGLHHGKYQTAMLYDTRNTNEAFQKWSLGHREY